MRRFKRRKKNRENNVGFHSLYMHTQLHSGERGSTENDKDDKDQRTIMCLWGERKVLFFESNIIISRRNLLSHSFLHHAGVRRNAVTLLAVVLYIHPTYPSRYGVCVQRGGGCCMVRGTHSFVLYIYCPIHLLHTKRKVTLNVWCLLSKREEGIGRM